ncbi:ATP-binding cassette long-chain fatty acid transporter pxa1 [Rhodotorula toruloides]
MAPAQSKLAQQSALTGLRAKGGAAVFAALVALVYLRRKVVQAAAEAAEKRNRQMLTTPQIELAQRDLYNPLPGGARELLVPARGRVSKVLIKPTKATTFARHRPLFRKPPPAARSASSTAPPSAGAAAQRVGVNKEFFRQLSAIFRIIIPHATSKEVWLVGAHTAFLLLRTYLSLLVAQLDGKLVGDLVSANGKGFLRGLCYWFLLAIPSVYTNAMIRFLQSKLSISFRTRLTRYVHDLYLDKNCRDRFYDGAPIEKDILTKAYLRLIKHVNSIYKMRILYGMTEDMVVKYLWSAAGYCLISIPVFFPKARKLAAAAAGTSVETKDPAKQKGGDGLSISQRTENYISNRRLLLSLADAGGRLMLSWKDLSELAGSTSRVYTLLSTLHDLSTSTYTSLPRPADLAPNAPFYDLGTLNGRFITDAPPEEGVTLDKVPIVAPAPGVARGGEELVHQLSVRVKPGEHLLITGGNGTGKTAIARVLAGLWPVWDGVVVRPDDTKIMFLPQRPYLSSGSLRDQIIYPHSYPDFVKSGKTDEDLMEILRKVHLSYLPSREGGYDVRKEWKDILSGGEKQRMGMARLFYHLPKYGVLDECTSAVSTDVEGSMYQHAKDVGITLITISHRPSLFKHHMYLLRLTGVEGQWEMTQIGEAEQSLSFQKEIESLQAKLAEVETWKNRLSTIDAELHFKET